MPSLDDDGPREGQSEEPTDQTERSDETTTTRMDQDDDKDMPSGEYEQHDSDSDDMNETSGAQGWARASIAAAALAFIGLNY